MFGHGLGTSVSKMTWYSSFSTDEPEVAEEFISAAYVDVSLSLPPDEGAFSFADRRLDGGSFHLDDMEIAVAASFNFEPEDIFMINQVGRGRLRVTQARVAEEFTVGELAMVGRPEVETTTEVEDFAQHVVTLQASVLREAAGIEPESDALPTFSSVRPVSTERAASWRRTLNYVGAMLRGDPAIAEAPLVVGSVNRLLAGLVLATFPNDAVAPPERRDERGTHSAAALRRAVAFVDAAAELDIGIGDIAAAAGLSRRATQLAFRRHLDTTPTAYLRKVRLDGAHRELLDAQPGSGVTVTEVAYRWGFSSPSRFAERYRAEYGFSPSHSLRR
jgi:AraC-like DNA-binding protein